MSTAEQPPDADDPRPARLNQPWRGLVALGEAVLAAVAVVVAIQLWNRGVTTMVTPLGAGLPPLKSTIFYANWMAAAIGLITIATFLTLDGLRQALLAIRTRRRPLPPLVTAAAPR